MFHLVLPARITKQFIHLVCARKCRRLRKVYGVGLKERGKRGLYISDIHTIYMAGLSKGGNFD